MKNFSRSRAWVVLWAAIGLNFLTGLLYIWSIISKGLITELQWSSKQASLPYTVATLSFVIFMAIFGKIQDSKGPRFTATLSAILMGVGLILSGFMTSPVAILVTFGIITGAGIGIGSISTMPAALKWFSSEAKGKITGAVTAAIAVASMFYAPVANILLRTVGISKTFLFIGIGVLVTGLILAQLLRNPPEGLISGSKSESTAQHQASHFFAKDINVREMIRKRSFYKLWLMLAFSSSAGLMLIGHVANIAKIQVNWEGGFILVVLLSIFNSLGRLLGGAISDKIGRINLLRIIFSLQAVNMILFSRYESVPLLAIGIALGGLTYGATFAVYPAASVDFYGIKNFGTNYGVLFTAWGVGGMIGPMMAAALFDATRNYNISYLIAGLLLIIAIIISFTFRSSGNKSTNSCDRAITKNGYRT